MGKSRSKKRDDRREARLPESARRNKRSDFPKILVRKSERAFDTWIEPSTQKTNYDQYGRYKKSSYREQDPVARKIQNPQSWEYYDTGIIQIEAPAEKKKQKTDPSICEKRQIRKEVLHALGKTGAGQKQKDPVFTQDSKKRCK